MRSVVSSYGIKALVIIGSIVLSVIIVYSIFLLFFPENGGIDALGMTVVLGLFPVILLSILFATLILRIFERGGRDQSIEEQHDSELSLRKDCGGPGYSNDQEGPTDYRGIMRYNRGIDRRDHRRR